MKGVSAAVALVAAAIASAPASAVTYSFTLSGGYNASWLLDSSPTPDHVDSDEFFINDVEGEFDGLLYGPPELIFYTIEDEDRCSPFPFPGCRIVDRQGLQIIDFNAADPVASNAPFSAYGDHFWTGTLDEPTFQVGTYVLTGYGGAGATLTIAEAVPEPATWAMMIAGFGAVGAVMRRRRMPAGAAPA